MKDEIERVPWDDDSLFFTHTFRDETSMYDEDPSLRWEGGGEYYSREYSVRVPKCFERSSEMIDAFISMMEDRFPDCFGFYGKQADAAREVK